MEKLILYTNAFSNYHEVSYKVYSFQSYSRLSRLSLLYSVDGEKDNDNKLTAYVPEMLSDFWEIEDNNDDVIIVAAGRDSVELMNKIQEFREIIEGSTSEEYRHQEWKKVIEAAAAESKMTVQIQMCNVLSKIRKSTLQRHNSFKSNINS